MVIETYRIMPRNLSLFRHLSFSRWEKVAESRMSGKAVERGEG